MGHALRGAITAWLALIAIETLGTSGTGPVGNFFADANALVKRALDPSVPAIPDRRNGSSSAPLPSETAAAGAAAGAAASGGAVAAVTRPGGALSGMPSLSQYVNGGGLPGLANNPALQH